MTGKVKCPLIKGIRLTFQIGYQTESGIIKELVAEVDHQNGKIIKKNPRMIAAESMAVILVSLDQRTCMETSANFDCYARVQIMYESVQIAFGKINELID